MWRAVEAVASAAARQKARTRQRKTSRGDIAPSLTVTLAFANSLQSHPASSRTSSDRQARPHADEPQCREGILNVRMSKPDGPRAIRAGIAIFFAVRARRFAECAHDAVLTSGGSTILSVTGRRPLQSGDGASLHPIGTHLMINIDPLEKLTSVCWNHARCANRQPQ
jgi:hypothetical protein